jgi:hypothetical protein
MVGDAELDELFATNPAKFVAARDALAKKVELPRFRRRLTAWAVSPAERGV